MLNSLKETTSRFKRRRADKALKSSAWGRHTSLNFSLFGVLFTYKYIKVISYKWGAYLELPSEDLDTLELTLDLGKAMIFIDLSICSRLYSKHRNRWEWIIKAPNIK